jgi:hypothetical protein
VGKLYPAAPRAAPLLLALFTITIHLYRFMDSQIGLEFLSELPLPFRLQLFYLLEPFQLSRRPQASSSLIFFWPTVILLFM